MNTPKIIWDPFVGSIGKESLQHKGKKIQKKLDKYLENPGLPIRNLLLCSLPGILTLGSLVIGFSFFFDLLSIPPHLYIFLVFLSFTPVFFYYGYIHNLERDLVKLLVARKKQWAYNPDESAARWTLSLKKFPRFFTRGNQGQNLQDEFWGTFEEIDFYQSIFRYQRRTGHGKRRRVKTYHKTVFAIKLPKNIRNEFQLEPAPLTSWSPFKRKTQTLSTESHEFNQYYKVTYNGQSGHEAINIIRTLSPALLEKLINLKKSQGETDIYFKGESVIFMFSGRLLPKMKTNFFKKVELDDRDQEFIEKRLENIFKISQEMLKYLD